MGLYQYVQLKKNGEPWFVAKDICDALVVETPKDSIARLDDDERGRFKIATIGGFQDVSIISESGMYSLLLSSRQPKVKILRLALKRMYCQLLGSQGGIR